MIQLKSIIRHFSKRPKFRLLKRNNWFKNRLIRSFTNNIEVMDPKQRRNQEPEIVVPTVDKDGNPLSKNAIKKLIKAEKKRLKKLEKERLKAEKAKKQGEKKQPKKKKKRLGEEITDPQAYFKNRSNVIMDLKKDINGPYFPFPHKWPTTHIIPKFVQEFDPVCTENQVFLDDQEVSVAGRILSIRELSAGLIFYDLVAEGSKVQIFFNLQAFPAGEEHFDTLAQLIKRGDIIGVKGNPGRTKTGELSIRPTDLRLLSPCLHMLPSQRIGVKDPEIRYRQRYLDMIINKGIREKFMMRSRAIKFIRKYLDERGFSEVETPVLNILAGGATAKPFVTHHNALKRDLFMRVAPELFLKTLIIGGMDRVYEIGKNFRNEGIDHTHNPEFTSCEFYWAYADFEDLMDLTEDMLSTLVKELTGDTVVTIQDEEGNDVKVDFKRPWKRISMMEELGNQLGEEVPQNIETEEARQFFDEQCKKHNVDCAKPRSTARLIDKLVGHFIEENLVNPTFLIEHPQLMCPLAKYHRSKPGLTERFELFINKHEFANAYTELNDPFKQKELFLGQADAKADGDDEAHPIDEGYVKAMEHGLPPTAGWGLGVDRLCMLLTNSVNIQEVILFPAMKPKENDQEGETQEATGNTEITENQTEPVEA